MDKKKIKIQWTVKTIKNTARVNMMYCFKNCEANQN